MRLQAENTSPFWLDVRWRVAAALAVVGLALYAWWDFSSAHVAHPLVGNLIVLSFYVAGAVAAWLASRRCGDPRTRSAWRWVVAGSVLLAAAVVSTIGYQAIAGAVPFPSIVDLCYLAFYPVCLIGILRFPTRRESRHARLRLGLDAATIALAGGSIIWYLVLGPTVAAGGSNLQIRIVSGAYPTGDLLQIFAMARLLTRVQAPALRVPLRFFTGALFGAVVGDVLFGWLQFHPNAGALKAGYFILALAAASSLLAGASQRPGLAVSGPVLAEPDPLAARRGRVIWLPYFAPFVVLGLLVHSQLRASFFSRLSLTIAAGVVMLLVALRQLAVQRELIAVQRVTDEQAKELRTAVVELEAAQRIKEDFISLVSHELRTPLTSIRGYTELLLEDGITASQRDFLNVVDRNAERLLSVVNDLLLVAQIQGGTMPLEFGDLLLNDLVEQAGAAAQPLATSRKIGLEIIVDPDLALTGDASRLGQVLDNLISNALKYTPEGGTVTLRATRVAENAVVEVADTGIGIPKAEQEQMFGRFFRTSNARLAAIPGTGLGLVVTRGIVEGHGGTIGFESAEGIGTTFRVVIPLTLSRKLQLVA